jgi:hypothetical protein
VDVLAAWDALARADTSAAITRLEALAPVDLAKDLAWGVWQGLGAERMLLARLYFARQEFERAILVAGVLDHPQPMAFLPFRPESLRIRADAAEALGRAGDAASYRQRLDRLRDAPVAADQSSPQS